ncbi:MAG: hydroxymethylglutaryl-CoA reductase [Thermoanaerobaculia bacterium]|nr:hydroxymethylglutaryl-CoA reductase [Thermoanaerobaculia bacterium]
MLFRVPQLLLKQLYTFGSLENTGSGVRFALKNRLSDATIESLSAIAVGGVAADLAKVRLELPDGSSVPAREISAASPLDLPLKRIVGIRLDGFAALAQGNHEVSITFSAKPFGELSLKVNDAIAADAPKQAQIPYDKENDHSAEWIARRRQYAENYSGNRLEHVSSFSFDPATTRGNVENLVGAAQVPIGLAGPLRVNGEHARGEFLIPLATTEGTLVASYSRGMKVLNLSGGVTCTVLADAMQRAPVFVFDSAREARDFAQWVERHLPTIREHAESTSSVAKLLYIDTYLAAKFAYLRFNFATGDAAGQNMVGRATFAACSWVLEQEWPKRHVRKFYLESNLATDKKASQVNVMKTRGKRVVAECTIPREVLVQNMRVEPEQVHYHGQVANVGTMISGANNNGAHSPNGITAMFIATGQDVANVAESSAGIVYSEVTAEGDLYISMTIPSLIVATHGGGTGLATQRECLEMLGCTGRGTVNKFAEIVAGVVLAGEISLAAAISSLDWVSSHEKYGRNR